MDLRKFCRLALHLHLFLLVPFLRITGERESVSSVQSVTMSQPKPNRGSRRDFATSTREELHKSQHFLPCTCPRPCYGSDCSISPCPAPLGSDPGPHPPSPLASVTPNDRVVASESHLSESKPLPTPEIPKRRSDGVRLSLCRFSSCCLSCSFL
jgi:hypothetical protein